VRARFGTGLLALVSVAAIAWIVWIMAGDVGGYEPAVVGRGERTEGPAGVPWRGAVHVHTSLSGDARGTIQQVADAAAAAGLDFVLVSEHTRASGASGQVKEGWYGGVLVVVGEEIPTMAGHLLAIGIAPHRPCSTSQSKVHGSPSS